MSLILSAAAATQAAPVLSPEIQYRNGVVLFHSRSNQAVEYYRVDDLPVFPHQVKNSMLPGYPVAAAIGTGGQIWSVSQIEEQFLLQTHSVDGDLVSTSLIPPVASHQILQHGIENIIPLETDSCLVFLGLEKLRDWQFRQQVFFASDGAWSQTDAFESQIVFLVGESLCSITPGLTGAARVNSNSIQEVARSLKTGDTLKWVEDEIAGMDGISWFDRVPTKESDVVAFGAWEVSKDFEEIKFTVAMNTKWPLLEGIVQIESTFQATEELELVGPSQVLLLDRETILVIERDGTVRLLKSR